MEDLDTLMEAGLTKAEAKIYLTLLKNGPLTAGKIVTLSHQHISVTYAALQRLVEKGYVSYIKKGRFSEYFIADPEIFLEKMKSIAQSLEEKLPVWKEYLKLAKNIATAEVFDGVKAISNIFFQILKNGKKGEVYRIFSFGKEIFYPGFLPIFKRNYAMRKRIGIKTIAISNKSHKEFWDKVEDRAYVNHYNLKLVNFNFPQGIVIFQDNVILFSFTTKEPKVIHIKDAGIADEYKKFFDNLYAKGLFYSKSKK